MLHSSGAETAKALEPYDLRLKFTGVWLNFGDDRERSLSFHLLRQHSFPLHSEQCWVLDGKSSQPSISVSGSGKQIIPPSSKGLEHTHRVISWLEVQEKRANSNSERAQGFPGHKRVHLSQEEKLLGLKLSNFQIRAQHHPPFWISTAPK